MFRHTSQMQFDVKVDKPDALFARKVQELIGGAFGEMSTSQQYLFQGWNCRMPGKYKDMIMDIATEEIGHVEMLATLVARLLEHAPSEVVAEAVAADPATAAIIGGMNPQHAIVAGGGALPADSNGNPWRGDYIVASGNLMADFRSNVALEAQGRLQTARLYNMTDDPGVRATLQFNLARDTMHQLQWLAAIEQLQEDGLEGIVVPNALFDEEAREQAGTLWHLSDGPASREGKWASGMAPDGQHEFTFLEDPQPQGGPAAGPAPDPLLYATYNTPDGGIIQKVKDKLS